MAESRSTPLHLTTIGPMTEKTARVLISVLEACGFFELNLTHYIQNGADVNAVDHIKQTPLHGAANFCRQGLAKIFLDHGAKLTTRVRLCSSSAVEFYVRTFEAVHHSRWLSRARVREWWPCWRGRRAKRGSRSGHKCCEILTWSAYCFVQSIV